MLIQMHNFQEDIKLLEGRTLMRCGADYARCSMYWKYAKLDVHNVIIFPAAS